MPSPFVFDEEFSFAVTPAEFWAAVVQTDQYPTWWTWLRRFDGEGLQAGASARCTIQAPLPYALRFTVHVDEVVPSERVETTIAGDLEGPARLEVAGDGEGCVARLAWSLHLRDPVLRRLAVFARPAMSWAHDRVVAIGLRQFEQRALAGVSG